jgi:hypothetical protein
MTKSKFAITEEIAGQARNDKEQVHNDWGKERKTSLREPYYFIFQVFVLPC